VTPQSSNKSNEFKSLRDDMYRSVLHWNQKLILKLIIGFF
jgi:hypothetical protein